MPILPQAPLVLKLPCIARTIYMSLQLVPSQLGNCHAGIVLHLMLPSWFHHAGTDELGTG